MGLYSFRLSMSSSQSPRASLCCDGLGQNGGMRIRSRGGAFRPLPAFYQTMMNISKSLRFTRRVGLDCHSKAQPWVGVEIRAAFSTSYRKKKTVGAGQIKTPPANRMDKALFRPNELMNHNNLQFILESLTEDEVNVNEAISKLRKSTDPKLIENILLNKLPLSKLSAKDLTICFDVLHNTRASKAALNVYHNLSAAEHNMDDISYATMLKALSLILETSLAGLDIYKALPEAMRQSPIVITSVMRYILPRISSKDPAKASKELKLIKSQWSSLNTPQVIALINYAVKTKDTSNFVEDVYTQFITNQDTKNSISSVAVEDDKAAASPYESCIAVDRLMLQFAIQTKRHSLAKQIYQHYLKQANSLSQEDSEDSAYMMISSIPIHMEMLKICTEHADWLVGYQVITRIAMEHIITTNTIDVHDPTYLVNIIVFISRLKQSICRKETIDCEIDERKLTQYEEQCLHLLFRFMSSLHHKLVTSHSTYQYPLVPLEILLNNLPFIAQHQYQVDLLEYFKYVKDKRCSYYMEEIFRVLYEYRQWKEICIYYEAIRYIPNMMQRKALLNLQAYMTLVAFEQDAERWEERVRVVLKDMDCKDKAVVTKEVLGIVSKHIDGRDEMLVDRLIVIIHEILQIDISKHIKKI